MMKSLLQKSANHLKYFSSISSCNGKPQLTNIVRKSNAFVFRAFSSEAPTSEFRGVFYDEDSMKKWQSKLIITEETEEGEQKSVSIDGGKHWTEEDAARAYDALVDLYLGKNEMKNFKDDESTSMEHEALTQPKSDTADWRKPEYTDRKVQDIIPIRQGEYLTKDEVVAILEEEKAVDIYSIDLKGKSSLADHMIFCTGRSKRHMQKMADLVVEGINLRNIEDDFEYGVEDRESNEWMIVDCNKIVVHFFKDSMRKRLKLEEHWENMQNDKHTTLGDMTAEEYVDKFGAADVEDEFAEDDDSEFDEIKYEMEILDGVERDNGDELSVSKIKDDGKDWV